MLDQQALLRGKIAVLEYLVRTLYYQHFKGAPDPVGAARAYAERIRATMESTQVPGVNDVVVMAMTEMMNSFFETLIQQLAEERNGRPPTESA